MSTTPGALKRKHPEKTIKEHFISQQKPHSTTAREELSPESKKRAKVTDTAAREDRQDTADSETPHATPAPQATPSKMSTADMYHFPSKKDAAVVVDLTSSPTTTPTKPARKAVSSMHAPAGPKRLMVKNFKPTRRVDPKVFLEQTWAKIDRALDTIFAGETVDFSLEELYRGVENLCRQNMARDVKERLIRKCKSEMGARLLDGVKEAGVGGGGGDVGVLRGVLKAWGVWGGHMVSVCRMLCFDRRWLTPYATEIPRLDLLLPRPRIPPAAP